VHIGNASELVLGSASELQGEFRRGTTSTPSEVSEEWPQGLHLHNSLAQVLYTLSCLWGKVLEGEPAWWELCHEVRDLVVVGVRHDSGLAAGKGKAAKALGVFGLPD